MIFTIEAEPNNKMPFFDVNVNRERGKLQQMSIKNQVLVMYTPILIAFYLAPTKLAYISK